METKRSKLRFTLTVSLALAGLAATAAVVLYHAAPARAQDQEPDGQVDPGNLPDEPIFQLIPQPEPQPEPPRIQFPDGFDPRDLANGPEGADPRDPTARPTSAPSTAPSTGPAAVEPPAEPVRPAGPPPRGTRVRTRGSRTNDTFIRDRAVEPGAAATEPADASASQPTTGRVRIGFNTGNNVATGSRPPTTRPGAVRVGNGHGGIILNFQDASIEAVLEELSSVAGFKVLKEVARLDGKVNLISPQPLTPNEVLAALDTELRKNGYAAVRRGDVLRVMQVSTAKKAAIPVRTGNDPNEIEPTDQLITQVIPIRNAEASQLKEDLAPLINASEADFSANASSNSLIITDTSANIRRLVEIVSALDTHMSNSVSYRVFNLKFASAASTAKLITEIFAPPAERGQNQQPQIPSFFANFGRDRDRGGDRGGDRNRGGASPTNDARTTGKVSASSDDRTNTVVVTGPPDTLDIVETIVHELDSDPTDEQSVFVYSLRNAQAAQLELVINSLFNGTGGIGNGNSRSQIGRSGALGSGGRAGSSTSGSSGRSGGSSFGGSSGGSFGGGNSFGSNRAFGGGSSSVFGGFGGFGGFGSGVSQGASRSASSLQGQVTVVADADTNSILVMTSPKNFERVKLIIEELDRPVPQVLIKVLIAEVTHDNAIDIGTEFSALNISASGRGATAITDFGLASATGGLVVKALGNDVSATLRALERNGKLDVLSRPYILGSDNQLASIEVGQLVPFPRNSQTTDQGTTNTSITYDSVGIILDVVPHINPDGVVIMDVQPTISALTNSNVQISETFSAPIVNNRSAQSRVAIENGKTIVIGGLMEDRLVQTIRKVPFLGDIPIIGLAFQRLEKTKTKTELLIFLTPHVAPSPSLLPGMSDDETGGTKLLPGAVAPGAYEYHREGLQRGATHITPRGGVKTTGPSTQPSPGDPVEESPLEVPTHDPRK